MVGKTALCGGSESIDAPRPQDETRVASVETGKARHVVNEDSSGVAAIAIVS